jgi:hypothetical protein
MKNFFWTLVGLIAFASASARAGDVMTLTSSQSTYTVGESAVLQARSLIQAQDPSLEIFFTAEFDGLPMPIQIVDSSGFSTTSALSEAGTHHWTVQLYLRDAKLAKELNDTLTYLTSENDRIDQEIAEATDPEVIAQLQAEKDRNLDLIDQAEAQLVAARTAIGAPQTLDVQVSE